MELSIADAQPEPASPAEAQRPCGEEGRLAGASDPRDTPQRPNAERLRRFEKPHPLGLSWPARLAMLYAGAVLPVICFLIVRLGPPRTPSWQDGVLHSQAAFLLGGPATWVFYPLLAFAIYCFLSLLFRTERYVERTWARLGLYSGIVLALHYSVIHGIVLFHVAHAGSLRLWWYVPLLAAIAIAVPWSGWWLWRRARQLTRKLGLKPWHIVAVIAVPLSALALWILLADPNYFFAMVSGLFYVPVILGVVGSLVAAPYWTLFAYSYLALRIARHRRQPFRFSLMQLMAVVTWLAVYMAALRYAIQLALAEYRRLPTEPPPQCYVATAAARGHRRWVGGWLVRSGSGQLRQVTRQLVVLKCGEIALAALCPGLHRRLRRVYDRLGPRLAARIRTPWQADAAHLLLTPCEWTARAALAALGVGWQQWSEPLYGPRCDDDAQPASRADEGPRGRDQGFPVFHRAGGRV